MIGNRLHDRYEILQELGRGGMGVVYRGFDPRLEREVAIKLISPGALKPGAAERFAREARIVARMDHPGIVPVLDFGRQEDGEHAGLLFFVMPLIEGETLRQWLERRGTEPADTRQQLEAVEIVAQAAEALEHCHARGVVHGDIKPENLMIARLPDGALRVRVMDFGVARLTRRARSHGSSEERRNEEAEGGVTEIYASPEQILGVAIDGRADFWSLGILLYECLSGTPPFKGSAAVHAIVHRPPPSLAACGLEIGEELQDVLLSCLAKQPEHRPARGTRLAAALRGAAQEGPSAPRPRLAGPAERAGRSPLVGRETPWWQLCSRLASAAQGEGQLVLIGGEAGLGKSRLLMELESLCRIEGRRVLHGWIAERTGGLPYQGLCEALQEGLREVSREGAGGAGTPDFSDLAPELLAHFPALSEMPELQRAAGQVTVQTAARGTIDDPVFLFELLGRSLLRLSGGEPLVLLLEQLHCGEDSIEAIDYLFRRLSRAPILIAGTYRPGELGRRHALRRFLHQLGSERRALHLMLQPLSPDALGELLRWPLTACDTSREVRLEEGLEETLAELTEGNPHFALELGRSWIESGALHRDDEGVWRLRRKSRAAWPTTVQETVRRRLELLPADGRTLLDLAAVLGRDFTVEDLENLASLEELEEERFDAALDGLLGRGLVEEKERSQLRFASGVVREIVYESLGRRRRRALHRRFARLLEERWAGRLERVHAPLLEHCYRGDLADETVRYGLATARTALEAMSPEEALTAVQRALERLEECQTGSHRAISGELHLLASRAESMARRGHAALIEASRAVDAFAAARRPARMAMAALIAAETAWSERRAEIVPGWVELGVELARATAEREALCRLLALGATVATLRGEHGRARELLAEARDLEPAASDEDEAEEIPSGGTLVVGHLDTRPGGQPIAGRDELDPAELQTEEESEIEECIFEPLLRSAREGGLIPVLAESCEATDDYRRFTFVMRAGLRFSDGSPLGAAEVKASFERAARRASRQGGVNLESLLSPIEGYESFVRGTELELRGIEALPPAERGSGARVLFHLSQPLPIFPTLLTHTAVSIVRPAGGRLLGTGPFRLARRGTRRIVLEPNPHARHEPRLAKLEFRPATAADLARELRAGGIDLARDLSLLDVEDLRRDPRFAGGVVEVARKNVYFALLHPGGPMSRHRELRRALYGVIHSQDLVWGALGRYAQPAVGVIPPGLLGHDAGRRPPRLTLDEALDLLERAGLAPPIRLRAAAHTLFTSRYRALTDALLELWSQLGVEVEIENIRLRNTEDRLAAAPGIDLLLDRWNAAYDDPDNFTFFHSESGRLRDYYSSSKADHLIDEARSEPRSDRRRRLYQRFEDLLSEQAILVPLFHDVDHRIAGPRVRGLELRATRPHVDYGALAKARSHAPVIHRSRSSGEIHVPLPVNLASLDPGLEGVAEKAEATANVFESLTRVAAGAQPGPWLARRWQVDDRGRRYRFLLRSGLRFHDGRRLSARDVRATFERVLRSPFRRPAHLLLPLLGAAAFRAGERDEIAGVEVISEHEIALTLEHPLPFFLALLTHPALAVVPESAEVNADGFPRGSWRDGCSGTGPFRVVHHGRERLEMAYHPDYWRPAHPRCQSLVFHLAQDSTRIAADFRRGVLTLASHLRPEDLSSFEKRPEWRRGYRESPRLMTYFLAMNAHHGPLAEPAARRALYTALDADAFLEGLPMRRASGLFPPGLLGYEADRPVAGRPEKGGAANAVGPLRGTVLRVFIHPEIEARFGFSTARLEEALDVTGVRLEKVEGEFASVFLGPRPRADLALLRWGADYPDTDGIAMTLLHSREGFLAGLCGSPQIDRFIEEGRRETDPALRHAFYCQIEEILAREHRLLPLCYGHTYRLCQPALRGLDFNLVSPEVRYDELYLEP